MLDHMIDKKASCGVECPQAMEYRDQLLIGLGVLGVLIFSILTLLYLKRDKEEDEAKEAAFTASNIVLADIHIPIPPEPKTEEETIIPVNPPIIVVTQPPTPNPEELFTK